MKKKKEVKTKEKTIETISDNKQRRIKLLSKVIYISARILKVLSLIAVSFLLLMVVLIPVVVKNIKIEDDTISIFDVEIGYRETSEGVDLLYDDYRFGNLTSEEKVEFDALIKELSASDMPRAFGLIELATIVGVATCFMLYFIFTYTDSLFFNIYSDDTPFTKKNSDYLNKIAYLSLITVIISFVADVISSLLFNNSMVNFSLSTLLLVLVLYTFAYVFEYACVLQSNSKSKLYVETKK